jgi:SRSO17 transposase
LGERPGAAKKNYVPEEVKFRTKPQIALELIDRALGNGVRVAAWTFDELYGRDGKFLDGLEQRRQIFVGEVPKDFHGWVQKPRILRSGPKKSKKCGSPKKYPRLAGGRPSCEVQNLATYSPLFREQSWQRYRIKDTDKGPEVWEVKWAVFWRKSENGLPGRRHCLIVAHNVLTEEVKYFVANISLPIACPAKAGSPCEGCCGWPLVAGRWSDASVWPRTNWGWITIRRVAGVACIGTSI